MSVERIVVVPNARAGRGRANRLVDEVRRAAEADGATVELLATTDVDELDREVASALAEERVDRIVAIGGDGLVHRCADALAGSDVVLGLVPAGTGDDFARAMGLVGRRVDPIATALGPGSRVDLLVGAGTHVASVATAGFSVDVNRRADALPRCFGGQRYALATVLELPRRRLRTVRLTVDEDELELDCALLVVANTAWFGNGMKIAPAADPTDGLAEVVVVGGASRTDLLRFFPRVFVGRHLDHESVTVLSGSSVGIEGDLEVWGDGERLGPCPLQLSVAPGALLVARG